MKTLRWIRGLLVAIPGLGLSASAVEARLSFDGVPSGSPANLASQPGITFEPASYGPRLDVDGVPLPGTESWRVDGSAPEVTVDSPAAFGRGPAPSGINALNALFQPVLLQFAAPQLIRQFSVTLDADAFGERGLTVDFFDSGNALLGRLSLDQTLPSFALSEADLQLAGVSAILLPAGAFYDNLAISSIPEPGAWPLGLLGGAMLAGLKRRVGVPR